jgi:sec-independent protein translocase protein TatC
MRPTEHDLFAEEQSMPTMGFGDHIEELRVRLILALIGLFVGLTITFIPLPISKGEWIPLGKWVMTTMQDPAQAALDRFYTNQAERRAALAKAQQATTPTFEDVQVDALSLVTAVKTYFPQLEAPNAAALKGQTVPLSLTFQKADFIETVNLTAERKNALISLAPLEAFMIYFMVCLITGLVVASPWVFYQIWAFIAAGLYRHERTYVLRYLPFSIGLFLGGVFLCFFTVLPFTLAFLLDFNVWLGIEPTLRIADWISFATILPLIFGVCFQTPLVMLLLERVGVFTAKDYRAKRRMAALVIVVAAAAITPTGDPFTMMLLAGPMYALYELGIRLIPDRSKVDEPTPVES